MVKPTTGGEFDGRPCNSSEGETVKTEEQGRTWIDQETQSGIGAGLEPWHTIVGRGDTGSAKGPVRTSSDGRPAHSQTS